MTMTGAGRLKRFGKRSFRFVLCAIFALQSFWTPAAALADGSFAFRGYGSENVTSSTFNFAVSDANISGSTVSMDGTADEGSAAGLITLNEGNDISTSVDLGGLEIDFSTVTSVTEEGENGKENDVPTVDIDFCSSANGGGVIASVHLGKSDAAVSGSVTLSSGAGIPSGTRSIVIYLTGKNTIAGSNNTVVFSNTSFIIRDSSAPRCTVERNEDWTNQDITVTINASDSDSGLEGIYVNDERKTQTSPYIFVVSENNTSFSAYSMDYAGKKSEVSTITIGNIDKTTPTNPGAITLSTTEWSKENVSVTMPTLSQGSGAPERYVYQVNAGDWSDMPDGFALSDNGVQNISVAIEDAAGNRSESVTATAKIDKLPPNIGTASQTVSSGTAIVSVAATDEGPSGIQRFRYAAGEHDAAYFTTGGSDIAGGTFTVHVGGTYTLYAEDKAGNVTLKSTELSTAPVLEPINDVVMNEDETKTIELVLSDAESALSELSIGVSTSDDALLKTVTVDKSGSSAILNITPALNQSGGPVKVTVTATDPSDQAISKFFNVTVTAVNDLPIAVDDSDYTLSEGSMIEIPVLDNDSDAADGDTLSIISAGAAEHGTTMIVLDQIRYTPDQDYAGADRFSYEISDGNSGKSTASVYVTVENINDAPTAIDDKATTQEDYAATIPVLANDSDVDAAVNDEESIELVSCAPGAHGSTSIDGNNIVYTPVTNYNGSDTFTYLIRDAAGLTAQANVTITISPLADDPWLNGLAEEYTIDEDSKNQQISFEILDVETPEDSLMLQAASLNADLIDQNNISISGLGDSNPAVTLSISPQANANGNVVIRLTLGDGFVTVVRDVTIHIRAVNDAPIVTNDTITYTEDADFVDISIADLLSNDRDVENDPLTFAKIVTDPGVGALTQPNSTTLRYIPARNYGGTDSFTYSVSDGESQTTATCTLKAEGVNDAPTISTETAEFAGTEDTLIVIPFEIEDNESAASQLEIITASNNLGIITTDGITIQNNNDGTGEVQIQPEADAYGDVQLTLTVSDGEAQSSIEVVVHVAPAQDAPVAVDDNIVIRFSSSRDFSVLTNDHDADGESLQVTSHVANLPGILTFDKKAQMFNYRPAVGENGISTFTYVVSDDTATATGTVTLDVTTAKHSPVITAIDTQYVQEDGSIGGIAFNVTDEDAGDTAQITVTSGNTTLLPNDDSHIVVTDQGSGQYALELSPAKDKTGSVNVTVTVKDGTNLTDSTTFTLRVLAQNDAPVAVVDEFTVNEDTSLVLDMLANDSDPDGDTIWLSSLSSPTHGSIERVENDYTYVPYEDWYGTETLSYSISDGRASASSSMTITVNPVNDAPVAWTDYCAFSNTAGISKTIDVLHNDYDVDTGDVLHISQIVTAPKYGTAGIIDGKITYTRGDASPEANGADSFVYRVIDRDTATGDYRYADATVYIGVEFHSSLYTYGRRVTCMEDADAFTFDLSVSNPNAVPYTLTVDSTTTLGTFTVVDNDTVRFAPAANQYGYQAITYTIEQTGGAGEKDTGTIWLRVYPVNDLPMIDSAPASVTMDEDTSAGSTFDVTFHDVDCATRVLYFYVYTTDASTIAPIPFQSGYTVTRTDTGATVTVKTAGNVNGTAKIVVGVSDGMTYDEQTIDLTVTPVDDAPIVNDVTRTIYEDSSVVFAAPGSDSEADGDFTHAMIMDSDEPANGTAMIRPNKTVYYMPDENFFGTDEFYVTITDQTATMLSSRAKVTIEVVPVNDQPEISDLGYYQTTLEDTPKDVYLTLTDVDTAIKQLGAFTLTSSNESVVENTPETLSIGSADGNQMVIHITPKANAYGTTKISLVASDGELSAEGSFELKVISVNDVPSAVNDVVNVPEAISENSDTTPRKTTAQMNLLSNDSDVEDGKPKVISITNVVNGTVTNLGGGKVQVSADGNFSGAVTFTYTVMDLAGAKASATGTLNIAAQNDPPRAADNSYTINEDARPTLAVLGNDSDPEGDTLTITAVSNPGYGTATIDGGNILYVPNADYFGADSFTYTISDGSLSATATVRITIKPINDAPTIAKHSTTAGIWTMDEDTPTAFNFVVADAESPVNRLIIKIVSTKQDLIQTSQIALSTNALGYKTITVTPVANASGTVPVTFLISDGLLTTEETYDIVINSANDAPVVTAPKQTMLEDTQLNASVTATDADGENVTFSAVSDPQYGVVTVNANGTYLYQPDPNFNGEDSFDIQANDGQATNNTGVATVYITVKPVGDPPTAADDEITINEDTPTTILVLANDTDEDILFGDAISVLRFTTPAHGTAEKKDGGILYTPAANYNGADSFSYTIADKDGKLDTAQVLITIRPVNDAPSNGNDTATTDEDTAITIAATANDDLDETTNSDLEDVTISAVDDPAHGTATLSTDSKSIIYTPDANWFSTEGSPEVFSYTATDKGGLSVVFTVTVTVNSVNDLPVLTPDNLLDVTTNEDTQTAAISFNVNDVEDKAGDLVVSVTHDNSVLLPAVTLNPNTDGIYSFTVTPKANKVGSATFTVTVTDADDGTDSDTFKLTVTPANDLPVAVDDAVTVAEGSSKTFDVLSNDDVDKLEGNGGDTLTLLTVGNASYGTATKEGNLVKYVSRSDLRNTANYTDTFTYIMQDASGAQSAAVVNVTVTPVNDIPTISAIANITGVQEDAADGTGEVSFNVTDEEDNYSTLQITVESSNPTLFPTNKITIAQPATNPDGGARTVKVIPAANQFGTGKITLTVKDSNGATASTFFWVTVDSVNDVPLNGDKSFTVVEDILTQLDVRKDIDPDYATTPDTILVTNIETNPSYGVATVAADGKSVYYTTNKDSNEPDSFEYTVHDSYGNADYTFTVNITVTPVNDAPVVHYTESLSYTTAEATAVNDIPFTVTDVDNVTDVSGSKPVEVTLSAESSNFILLKNGMNIDTMSGDNRNIDLKPYLKWNGSTKVTITATDPGGLKGTANFNLIVSSVNDAPVAVNDTGSILEDQPSVVYVMANDKDEDRQTNPDTEFIKIHSVTSTDPNATIEPTSDGLSVRITPKQDFNGTVSFTYIIEDSQKVVSNEATATYTVLQVNDAPQTLADTASTPEETAVIIPVLDNDADVDKDTTLNANPGAESISVLVNQAGLTGPSHGAVTSDNTTVTYTPSTNYNGTDTFEYYCYDGDVKTEGTVTVTISQVNDNPVAIADTASTNEDTATTAIDVLANDTDVDTDSELNLGTKYSHDTFTVSNPVLTTPAHGTVAVVDNKLVFTPANNWNGDEVVSYTLNDGNGGTATGTLTVTVTPENDLPVFETSPATMELTEDSLDGVASILVSDVETTADLLSVTVFSSSKTSLIATTDVTITAGSGGNRTVKVNPKNNQNGTAIITLKVTDANGGVTSVTFTVNVAAVNDTPATTSRTNNIAEDSGVNTLTKAMAYTDPDVATNADVVVVSIVTQAQHGTATVQADGSIKYQPNANYNGTDSYVYKATDSLTTSTSATITYNISQVNDAPTTTNDTASTAEDTAVEIFVLGNDNDIDKDPALNATPNAEVLSALVNESGLNGPSHGAVTSDGTKITYTPTANYNGTDTFEYYCYDGDVKVKGSVSVTISQVNDNPVAIADTTTVDEDHATSAIDVLANDTDVDTDGALNLGTLHERATFTISAASVTDSEHGTVAIVDNKLVFTPATNWFGTEVVNYTVSDGKGLTASSTLRVTVNSVNDLPVYATAPANMSLTEDEGDGTSAFVVGDIETAADLLTVIVSDISNTTLVGQEDITITGTGANRTIKVNPKDNQNGTAEITLLVTDADGGTATVKFTVDVTAVNDTPVVNAAEYDINEDASLQTKLKTNLASDVDIITNADAITLSITSPASHGTAAIDANGNVTYIPTKDFNGTDSFEYTATDKAGAHASKTLTFHVAQVNDAPVTTNDTANTTEDNAVVIPVLNNDTDIDKNTSLNAYPLAEVLSVLIGAGETGLVTPSHGEITTDGTTITYTPAADYNGTDTFDYYCYDGEAKTKGTVTVTITQVNDNPVAIADTTTVDEDHATSAIDVLANDTDVDTNGALNLGTLHERASFTISAASLTDSEHGTVAIVDNKLVFTPATNWFGTEVVNYTILDGNEGSASGTLSVTVNSVNDLPYLTMAPGYMYLSEDGADGISQFTVNDVETKASLLSVTVKSSSNPALVATSDITIQHTGGGSRTVTVNPKDDQNGGTLVTLTLEDEDGGKLDITMEVHVAAGNDKPVAQSAEYNISEDADLQTRLKADLTSDVDIATNGDSITLSISIPAAHGTAGIDANGNITYVPNKDFNGTDSFEYTATDKAGATEKATLTFYIAQVNDAPTTQIDAAETTEDHAVVIPVMGNDSDVDMDEDLNATPKAESIGVLIGESGLTAPLHGTITTDGTSITYTPGADYNGTDTFDYYCYDGELKTKGTVKVTITQVNDNPKALADSTTIGEDEIATVDVLKNDTDVDTDETLNLNELHNRNTFSIQDCYIYGVSHGTILVDGASVVYDPDDDFSGTQVIKYVLSDGHNGTSIGTLTIGVNAANDQPVAYNDEMTAAEDNPATVNVLTNDQDVDLEYGDVITFVSLSKDASGLPGTFITTADGEVTFTPNENYNGSFEIGYQMRDKAGLTSEATLKVTITPVNDKPTADNDAVSTKEDTAKDIDVSSLIGDVDILTNSDVISVSIKEIGEPQHGTATVDGTTITYTPNKDFNGTDAIIYTVTDKAGETDTGTLTITVTAVNDAPTAKADAKTTKEDTAVTILALENDGDIDTDTALNALPASAPVIQSVSNGTHGKASTDGTTITYTPDTNYNGTDAINYVLSDGEETSSASISLTMTQVNDQIQAANDAAETNDEDLVTIDVLANDTDVDTDADLNKDVLHSRTDFSITAVGKAQHGTTEIVSGKIAYTPEDRYAGSDSFTYTVSDGKGTTAIATVNIKVISVNDPPETPVVSKPAEGDRTGTASKVEVVWTGFDIDGDVLIYQLEYFDGKSWTLVADKLTDTKYTFVIPDTLASTNGLKFRVNASDAEYTSDYGYSGAMKVDKDAPAGTVVTMRTADGRIYTAGTWTNQTVRVVASSAVDASAVTYLYAMDGGTSAAGTGMDVTTGVHTVNIVAKDEYGNAATVGGYLARVDKQQPATPAIKESVSASGTGVLITLTFQTDPGGSGNDRLTLPDGTTVNAAGSPTFTAAKNGTLNFSLTDVAGNRKAFTYTVSSVDTSKPTISLASGAYRIGTKTQSAIVATLTYTDAESDLVTRGYQISESSKAGAAYKTYSGALTLNDAGTYYIHAFAKNAFGLTAYQTFGPFIIEEEATQTATPTPKQETGTVVVNKEDLEEVPGDTVSIRLPGQEWNETITLEDVGPGDYIVEAMDADGNIRTVEVHVTMRDIIARSLRSAEGRANAVAIAALAIAIAAAIVFAFLASSYNITVTVFGTSAGADKKIRAMRRIKFRKKELLIKLEDRHVTGGEYGNLKIAKQLSKKMRDNWVVVTIRGSEVLRVQIPHDMDEAFQHKLTIEP